MYYHFLSAENAINDLENNWIKISLIDELNDPFELLPYLRYEYEKRKKYHYVRSEIIKKWGILSFSKKWREPLLWSHYADGHKGVALGFEISQDKHEVIKIKYDSKPIREQVNLTENEKCDLDLVLKLAGIKYVKWGYEEEYRILVEINNCIKDNGKYFLLNKNDLILNEILLGPKIERECKDKVIKLAEKKGIRLRKTRLEWQGYHVNETS